LQLISYYIEATISAQLDAAFHQHLAAFGDMLPGCLSSLAKHNNRKEVGAILNAPNSQAESSIGYITSL
jgi:hypothetical protein